MPGEKRALYSVRYLPCSGGSRNVGMNVYSGFGSLTIVDALENVAGSCSAWRMASKRVTTQYPPYSSVQNAGYCSRSSSHCSKWERIGPDRPMSTLTTGHPPGPRPSPPVGASSVSVIATSCAPVSSPARRAAVDVDQRPGDAGPDRAGEQQRHRRHLLHGGEALDHRLAGVGLEELLVGDAHRLGGSRPGLHREVGL